MSIFPTFLFIDSLSGAIGSTLNRDLWKEPVVPFEAIRGEVPTLSDDIIEDLSTDQVLGYQYSHAIQSGSNISTSSIYL